MEVSMKVKVSVLMLTYNHENFIAQAIDSVISQKVNFDYEIVIGEDCSTDSTRNIVISYQQKYSGKIRLLLPKENLGMHQNFSQTLLACRGEYIALLEGDDYWVASDKLQKQVDFLEENHDCVICFHKARVVYEDGDQENFILPSKDYQKERLTLEDLLENNFMATASVMFRRGLVRELPKEIQKLKMGDWPLHILNAQHGDIGYIDEIMSVYRIQSGGCWFQFHNSQSSIPILLEQINTLVFLMRYIEFRYRNKLRKQLAKCYQSCGWVAFNSSQREAAAIYGIKAIAALPFSFEAWKLLACAAIKPLPTSGSK